MKRALSIILMVALIFATVAFGYEVGEAAGNAWLGIGLAVGIYVIAIGTIFYAVVLGPARRARRLMESGTRAEATVLAVWETGFRSPRSVQVGLRLRVQPAKGAPFDAKSSTVFSTDSEPFEVGEEVWVRYNPKSHRWVALEEETL
jgi:hypothetical protein